MKIKHRVCRCTTKHIQLIASAAIVKRTGKSLDVIDFVMYMENINKHEALEKCKELISGTAIKVPTADQLTKVAILTKMFIYFKNAVHNSKPAQEYLQSHGLDATKIEVGYNTAQSY